MDKCYAQNQSDEMYCAKCDLRWYKNDGDRPACKNKDCADNKAFLEAMGVKKCST